MVSRLGWGATATGAVRRMQPDSASAVMAAMIGRRNARATRTGVIPQSETALVLHPLWLTNGGWAPLPALRGERNGVRGLLPQIRSIEYAESPLTGSHCHAMSCDPASPGRRGEANSA